jgi:coenzyme Q-binding protein COQ10
MPEATRSVEINVPIDHLFQVVHGYQSYPEFIPEVKRIRVLRSAGNDHDVEFEIELDLPLGMKKKITYSLNYREDPPNSVTWKMIKGEMMKSNSGSWKFKSLGEGKTEAVYSIELSLGPLVPKSIANFLADQSLPTLLKQFKGRAESTWKK